MDAKNNDANKKKLEKVYNKIFEGSDDPQLTEEGRMLLAQLNYNHEDLLVRKKDYFFREENEPEEVMQIRMDHYNQKRYSKLNKFIHNVLFLQKN
jgi:hypothetical protein